jgi:hypothetical protein
MGEIRFHSGEGVTAAIHTIFWQIHQTWCLSAASLDARKIRLRLPFSMPGRPVCLGSSSQLGLGALMAPPNVRDAGINQQATIIRVNAMIVYITVIVGYKARTLNDTIVDFKSAGDAVLA